MPAGLPGVNILVQPQSLAVQWAGVHAAQTLASLGLNINGRPGLSQGLSFRLARFTPTETQPLIHPSAPSLFSQETRALFWSLGRLSLVTSVRM